MKYDLKEVKNAPLVKLRWHGEDTRVQLEKGAEKVAVKKGDVVDVSVAVAERLLSYSHLWTKDGDKPTQHPFDTIAVPAAHKAAEEAAKRAKRDKDAKPAEAGSEVLPSAEEVSKMTKKADVLAVAAKLGVAVNDKAKLSEIKDAVVAAMGETHSAEEAKTEDDGEGDEEEAAA